MKVSVIIPTYRRNKQLLRAIDSALNQTYPNCEVIVVDDNDQNSAGREATETIMKMYQDNDRVIYLKHEHNKGGSAARNTGWKASDADFIAFLDDDDEFKPDKINKQVEKLQQLPEEWGGCYCNLVMFKNDKTIHYSNNSFSGCMQFQLLAMQFDAAAGSTILLRCSVLENLNGFDESFIRHQDWEFLVRFFRKYKLALVPDVLVKIHVDNQQNRPDPFIHEKVKKQYLSCFKADIERYGELKAKQIYKAHSYELSRHYFLMGFWRKGCFWLNKSGYSYAFKLLRLLANIFIRKIYSVH